jgi:hypothetical protein
MIPRSGDAVTGSASALQVVPSVEAEATSSSLGRAIRCRNGRGVMPWFFFHIRDIRHDLSRDELGLDFPDVETAYLETFCAARDIGTAFAACGRNVRDFSIEVVNAADELIFRLPISEAIDRQVPRLPRRFLQ